jgi:hypothetical protein
MYYLSIVTLHIIFAGIWLLNFAAEPVLRKQIIINKNKSGERKFINLYLLFVNLFGMTGSMGILLTGIALVVTSGFFGFFQFGANHWLATKQVLLVVIFTIIGAVIIPSAKKVRASIGKDLDSTIQIGEDGYKALDKIYLFGRIINMLVLINFILALTHRYIG